MNNIDSQKVPQRKTYSEINTNIMQIIIHIPPEQSLSIIFNIKIFLYYHLLLCITKYEAYNGQYCNTKLMHKISVTIRIKYAKDKPRSNIV